MALVSCGFERSGRGICPASQMAKGWQYRPKSSSNVVLPHIFTAIFHCKILIWFWKWHRYEFPIPHPKSCKKKFRFKMRSNINLKGLPWTCILQRNVVSSLICLGDALLSFSEGTSDWNENIQVRFHIWVRWLFHLKSWNWSLSPFVLLELVKLHKHFTKNDIFHLMNKSLICLRSLNLLFLGALILQNLSASKKNPL